MKQVDFSNKKVAIIGLSVEGIATLNFMITAAAKVTVYDQREKESLPQNVADILKKHNIKGSFGKGYLNSLNHQDVIIRTPGMPLRNESLYNAKIQGAEVTSQTKLFFELAPCPIIGVTGTKGKGTTSTLIYKMLKKAGKKTYLGGNIGTAPLSFFNKLTHDSVVVLELSSFQLEDATLSPHIAVVLNISSEHLGSASIDSPNYHKTQKEYVKAKENIVLHQNSRDFAILNYDSYTTRSLKDKTKAAIWFFSNKSKIKKGAFVDGEKIILNNGKQKITVCTLSDVALIGRHNLENITAAVCTSYILGVSIDDIKKTIQTFKGLEHRLEFVRRYKGIDFYNDSFSTVPQTAIAAIQSFSQPIILICGGSEKNSDYTFLGREIIKNNVKAVILIGQMASRIEQSIRLATNEISKKPPIIIRNLKSMDEIVKRSASLAKNNDIVLLSPACASFDLFKNYKERGMLFKKYVSGL